MEKFTMPLQIRWSDIDANRHLRHSVYYDYGAAMRMKFLSERGLSTQKLEEFHIGPILLREEAVFRREIKLEDNVTIDVELLKTTADYGRWSLRHNLIKADGTVAAIITIDGAWIDMNLRKMAVPNEFIKNIFETFPRSPEFEWIVKEKK